MKKETKKPRFTAKCFTCNKQLASDKPIKHTCDLMINDHLKLTSKYVKGMK